MEERSMAVTRGKVTEHIVPYLPGFDLDPKDIRFLGTPIDNASYYAAGGSPPPYQRIKRSPASATRYDPPLAASVEIEHSW
jgi:hypothetical protein